MLCVFITAVPIIKLFAWGEGDSGGHVLREMTSRGLCGLVCPSRTSERTVWPDTRPTRQPRSNYAYSIRRLLNSQTQLSHLQVEGMLVSSQTRVWRDPTKSAQNVMALRAVLRSAVVKHAPLLADAEGTPLVQNIEDIDFAEIVTFTVPSPPVPGTTPVDLGTGSVPATTDNTHTLGSTGIRAVNTTLRTLAGILCGFVAVASVLR
jgi:hypothetical protein